MDALIVALDLINKHCGVKKYKKRVFLITDGEKAAKTNKEELKSLIDQLNDKDIRLNTITVDFANELGEEEDSEEEEHPSKSKSNGAKYNESQNQTANKQTLVKIID